MKNIFSKFSLATLIFANTICGVQAVKDVPNGHWARQSVDQVVNEYGFMQGSPGGYFGGNKAMTRYEFAKTLTRVIEHYNKEIESDREDIENVVSIMELFQNELKDLEKQMAEVDSQVDSQNQTVGELNELAITLGTEFNSLTQQLKAEQEIAPETERQLDAMEARLIQLEYGLAKEKDKGLIFGTLIKGTYNDIKKLGGATARVFSRRRKNVQKRLEMEESLDQTREELEENLSEQAEEAEDMIENVQVLPEQVLEEQLNTNVNIYQDVEPEVELLEEIEVH